MLQTPPPHRRPLDPIVLHDSQDELKSYGPERSLIDEEMTLTTTHPNTQPLLPHGAMLSFSDSASSGSQSQVDIIDMEGRMFSIDLSRSGLSLKSR